MKKECLQTISRWLKTPSKEVEHAKCRVEELAVKQTAEVEVGASNPANDLRSDSSLSFARNCRSRSAANGKAVSNPAVLATGASRCFEAELVDL